MSVQTPAKTSTKKRKNSERLPPESTLADEQRAILELLERTPRSVFITGRAGTGKSHLLRHLIAHSQKRLVALAPTGMAATNIGGQTIHSFFQLPTDFLDEPLLRKDEPKGPSISVMKKMETLVLDETSMIRADIMDAIDFRLRTARKSDEPFGGVQLILFGDPYQLPPVVEPDLAEAFRHAYPGPHFFASRAYRQKSVPIFELRHTHRHAEARFVSLLDDIREGKKYGEHLVELNVRVQRNTEEADGAVILTTTRRAADTENGKRLERLDGKTFVYEASSSGEMSRKNFPTDAVIRLKRGAQVMFVRNDSNGRWMNGTIGMIEDLSDDSILVNVGGTPQEIGRETWESVRYHYDRTTRRVEKKVIGTFTQYPLLPAWAMTIHKAQGQTYDRVRVDLGNGAFADGQAYVALSRCRTFHGLTLCRPLSPRDIRIDPAVTNFFRHSAVFTYRTDPARIVAFGSTQ